MQKFPTMTKKKIIWISVATVLFISIMIAVGIFLSNMFSFQKQLKESLDVSQLYITCESKYYSTEKEADNKEYVLSPIDMHYAKTEDGYDLKCGDLAVYDNVLYHNTIGPFLSSGSKAEVTTEDTVSEYQAYFENATKSISEYSSAPIYNYAMVGKALKEHKTLFTIKSQSGNETEYKLYFGKGFYKDVIKYVQGGDLIDFNKPMQYPVVVKFTEDRLSQVSIKINAGLEFTLGTFNSTKYVGTSTFDYNIYYDYEKAFSVTDEQKEYPYAFYQNCEPQKVLQLSSSFFYDAEYHNGKFYAVTDEYKNNRHTLEIYDLKTGALLKNVDLPKTAYNVLDILIHGDCVYVLLDPNDEYKVFCYNEKTGESILYDIPALKMFLVDDEFVVIENGKRILCGMDWDSLTETDKYADATQFYYDYYSGNTYAEREMDGKTYLVKLTKDGFSENKIELKYESNNNFRWGFDPCGITVQKQEIDEKFNLLKSVYTHYNFDLELIKEHEVEKYDGGYLGETEKYVFYTTFLFDKEKGRYYGFGKDVYYNWYAILDGVLYCNSDGEIFSSQEFEIEDNY